MCSANGALSIDKKAGWTGRQRRRAPVDERIVTLVKQAGLGVERTFTSDQLRRFVLEEHKGAFGY